MTYRDLAEFGLVLIGEEDERFPALERAILDSPAPFPRWPQDPGARRAVLWNQSGRAVIVLSFVWRYTDREGRTQHARFSNLGSSSQWKMLTGQSPVVEDLGTCILNGAKRLLTETGMFGNNQDVLPAMQVQGGYVGSGGGGSLRSTEETTDLELSLDFAVLSNGLCIGADEGQLFEGITNGLVDIQRTSREAARLLLEGATEGQVFDLLLPIAKQLPYDRRGHQLVLQRMFGSIATNVLLHSPRNRLVAWFEEAAEPLTLRLHRPESTPEA